MALVAAGCAKEPKAVVRVETKRRVEQIASPAGPNAEEPFLYATRDGLLLSWLEPVAQTDRTALRWSRFREGRWTAPRTIVERNDLFVNWADFPSIVEDAQGTLFAHWLQKSSAGTYAYDVRMAASTDGGATWGAPFLLNRDGTATEHGFASLAALSGGGIGVTWLDGRKMKPDETGDMEIRYATVAANGTVAEDVELDGKTCECCTTSMAMTATGPLIAYRDCTPDDIRDIAYVRRDGKGWSAPHPLHADGWRLDGCPVNGPQVDALGDHAAVAWFTAAQDRQRVYAAFSTDGGATFAAPVAIDDGKPVGRVDVVMLDADHALVSWLEQTAAGAEIRARRVSRGGGREASMKIADSVTARAAGFARMARSGSDVYVTWTEQSASAKRVHVARVGL
jgi:hypothetical protein